VSVKLDTSFQISKHTELRHKGIISRFLMRELSQKVGRKIVLPFKLPSFGHNQILSKGSNSRIHCDKLFEKCNMADERVEHN